MQHSSPGLSAPFQHRNRRYALDSVQVSRTGTDHGVADCVHVDLLGGLTTFQPTALSKVPVIRAPVLNTARLAKNAFFACSMSTKSVGMASPAV